MAFKMKGHSLPGPHQRKSPANHFEGVVHDHPHASGKKKTSKAMKRKIAEVKDANLKETNKLLVSQGKDPVKAIPDSPATSKSPAQLRPSYIGGVQVSDLEASEERRKQEATHKGYVQGNISYEEMQKAKEGKNVKTTGGSEVKRLNALDPNKTDQVIQDLKTEAETEQKDPKNYDAEKRQFELNKAAKRKENSPGKIAPLVMMGAQMLGKKMMEKKAEKDSPATQKKVFLNLSKKPNSEAISPWPGKGVKPRPQTKEDKKADKKLIKKAKKIFKPKAKKK